MDISDRIGARKRAGERMEDVIASKPTKAYDAKWGTFVISGDFFCNMVYRGL